MRAYDLIHQFIIELETISALVIMTYIVLFFLYKLHSINEHILHTKLSYVEPTQPIDTIG